MTKANYQKQKRSGFTRICPYCSKTIRYFVINLLGNGQPFFYSEESNDILMRESDMIALEKAIAGGVISCESDLERVWLKCLESAPHCSANGTFSLWANIKCPHCNTQFPYNQGVKNLGVRLYDSKVIVMDGANVINDDDSQSWTAEVEVNEGRKGGGGMGSRTISH